MKNLIRNTGRDGERGQLLVLFVFFLVVLILFVGLGIDVGFAYVTKAELAKAVDAAALAGMNSLSDGTFTASSVASATFAANYGRPGRDTGTVTPSIVFAKDAGDNTILNVNATATIKTFFIRVLPTWKTMSVTARSQATRAKLIMTLVLDRSGSMDLNGGADAMRGAVTNFVNKFDDNNDRVALVTYASSQSTDFQMGRPFKQPIIAKVKSIYPNGNVGGGTFSQGGLTNALVQNNSVIVLPGENVARVTVFFTDGYANIIQDRLNCPSSTLLNFGGYDENCNCFCVGFFDPGNGTQLGARNNTAPCSGSGYGSTYCPATTSFKSAKYGGASRSFLRANVTEEAEYRALQVAKDMRAAGTTVFSIGLGDDINKDFLKELANDPTGQNFDPNMPVGDAVFAPTADDLQEVFETIATRILLRLTQ
jgi:Flp pilus assembly protein TadG